MKRIILFIVLCFFTITCSLYAQIKVGTNGNVGINNTNPSYKLDISGNLRIVTTGGNTITFNGGVVSPYYGSYFDLGTSGNYWFNLWAYYPYFYYEPYIVSDINLKTNIKELPLVKDKIQLLRPVTYNLNPTLPESTSEEMRAKMTERTQYGFVAQEVQELFPDLVSEGEDGILSIQYTGLIPILVQAIKEQQAEIDALSKRIEDLESRIK